MSISVYRIEMMKNLLKEGEAFLSGKEHGEKISNKLSLYETSKKYDSVQVFFPKDLVMTTSFFLGMFEPSFKKYGLTDFCLKFKFLCEDPGMDEAITGYIERLSKDNPKKEYSKPEIIEADVCFINLVDDSDMDILATLKITASNIKECERNIRNIIIGVKIDLQGKWQVSDIIDAIRASEDVLEAEELESITLYV